jgi:thiamine-phosphate pyrophosphorylase
MQLCAITDRTRFSAHADAQLAEASLRQRLFDVVEGWTAGGVDFIQLREKDLDAPALQSLAREMMAKIARRHSKLLVNVSTPGSAALALAAGADGVHLAGKPAPGAARGVRQTFRSSGRDAIISMPCHSLEDIDTARKEEVDLVLFSPVFEKLSGRFGNPEVSPPQGLEALRRACAGAHGIPVFALGGVTGANAPDCLAAGAAGVAGIRLFAGDDWRQLRTQAPAS